MREAFRTKVPKGKIKVKYWIDKKKGKYSYWHTTAELLTDQILHVVNYYNKIDIKLTNRQLYYQLVGKDWIPNAMEIYKKLCVFLTDLRYCGTIDWNIIEDKGRRAERMPEWEGMKELISTATDMFRLPRRADQEYYIEIYCEKEAGINTLQPVADEYHVHFGYNKGYSSAAALYKLAQRLQDAIEEGKYGVILYFGDHDPSGLDMIRDISERVEEFLTGGRWPCSPAFKVIPVSLTMEQVEHYNPPPNPAKLNDPRSKWYIEKYGDISWELDAIDAQELRRLARTWIEQFTDMDQYNAIKAQEEVKKEALIEFGENYQDNE